MNHTPVFDLSEFESFPILKTKRLTLRAIEPTDAPALFAMQSDALLFRYLGKPPHQAMEETVQLIQELQQAYVQQAMLCWAATIRDRPDIIGTCGFNTIEPTHRRAEIGGALSARYWGSGVAWEAVEAILRYGFEGLRLHSIEAKINPANRSVVRLLKLAGFQKEAHFRDRYWKDGQWVDIAVYTLFESDFK
mgnify:CR=1 FL=1